MERQKKALKIVSYAIILMALVSIAMVAIDFLSGNYSEELLAKTVGSQRNSGLYIPYLIFAIGIVAITVLLYIFLGIRGIKQADGKVNKYGHITLATVLFVLDVISSIIGIFSMMNKTIEADSFSQNIVITILLFLYISSAKALKEN